MAGAPNSPKRFRGTVIAHRWIDTPAGEELELYAVKHDSGSFGIYLAEELSEEVQ